MNQEGAARNQPWKNAFVCLLLVAAVFAIYAQTFHYGFVNYDDDLIVTGNSHITAGFSIANAVWAFTHFDEYLYVPLTSITHMIDCSLYGLDAGGHHLTNVLLHAVSAVALFLALVRMTGAFWKSVFVAAVFAVHPLHVESVAWISERKDTLGGLYFMLTLAAYARYVKQPKSLGLYLAVIGCFAYALLSKPMMVTLPFLLLLLDFWPLQRWNVATAKRLVLEKIPLVVMSAAACVVSVIAEREAIQPVGKIAIGPRFANAAVSCVDYIVQTLHPVGMSVFYPHPGNSLPVWRVILSVLAVVCISGAAWFFRKRAPWFFTGWFWYLGMLVPVLGFVQVGMFARADRFMYLPQTGLCIAGAWAFAELCARLNFSRMIPATVMTVMLLAFAAIAGEQTMCWRDSVTLWSQALKSDPKNWQAHNSLGEALGAEGKTEAALSHFFSAEETNPRDAIVQSNIGTALLKTGFPDQAILRLQKALEINPRIAEAHNSLGNAYYAQGKAAPAISEYRAALKLDPENLSACNNLAWLLATSREDAARNGAESVNLAEAAVHATGGTKPALQRTLAAAYAETGQYSLAEQTAARALSGAESSGNDALVTSLREEIALYQSQKPLRRGPAAGENVPKK